MMSPSSSTPRVQLRFAIVLALVACAAGARFVPYLVSDDSALKPLLWNFSPVVAIALFGGARFASRWAAFLVPLLIMLISDLALHLLDAAPITNGWELLQQGTTYLVLVLVSGMGVSLQGLENRWAGVAGTGWRARIRSLAVKTGLIGSATVLSAVVFFLVSNFVVWLTASATMPPEFQYPKTLAGLLDCYVKALPFFRGTFWGNIYYAGLLFGGFEIAQIAVPGLRSTPREPALAMAGQATP